MKCMLLNDHYCLYYAMQEDFPHKAWDIVVGGKMELQQHVGRKVLFYWSTTTVFT